VERMKKNKQERERQCAHAPKGQLQPLPPLLEF
jgi:hypothetical protein